MSIGRNVVFNIIGFLGPAVILIVSYPPFLHALGAERFGILTLGMSLAAALSFLDLGLAAASLRFVVSDLHNRDFVAAARVITTTILFFTGLGVLISGVLFVLAPILAGWLDVVPKQKADAIAIFRLTAMQISFSLFLGTLSGLFKALDRFDLAAAIVTALALLMNALPALQVVRFGASLDTAIATTVVTLALLSFFVILLFNRTAARRGIILGRGYPDVLTFRRIFGFGATLMIHAMVGMLFTHGQRVLVGFLFGPVPVAAYQLSLTLVSKVHAGINAVAEVALPIASSGQADLIKRAYGKSLLILGALSMLPLFLIAATNQWLILLWLGKSAPPMTAELLPPICIAYFFIAISTLPYHILNGLGRPGVNVVFALINIAIFAVAILGFGLAQESSAFNVAVSFAISNVLCGSIFQWYCYYQLSIFDRGTNAQTLV